MPHDTHRGADPVSISPRCACGSARQAEDDDASTGCGAMANDAPADVWSRNTGPVSATCATAPCATGPCAAGIATGGGMYRAFGRGFGRTANRGTSSTSPAAGAALLVPGTQAPPFQ
ncbi:MULTISPECIES: hypothetical protein [unclassified Kitasatospora]|uniref:hypothetical protein n=1 Tax=unclassified Kitasatospora TaxID=2633591 RepID=UPI00247517C0|nr:hypothetical protein [Kitasatospora sp. MAP12-44]